MLLINLFILITLIPLKSLTDFGLVRLIIFFEGVLLFRLMLFLTVFEVRLLLTRLVDDEIAGKLLLLFSCMLTVAFFSK